MSHSTVPSQQELEKLPTRAIIAYTAKCARRIQPMYDLSPDTPNRRNLVTAIDQAITIAEQYSTGADQFLSSQNKVRAEQTAESVQKTESVVAGTARDAASIAAMLVKVVADILSVSVKADPNAASIYDEVIKSYSWDIAQDIVAQQTEHTRPARESEAEACRRDLAIGATSQIMSIASRHIEKDLLISDYQFVMEHLQT